MTHKDTRPHTKPTDKELSQMSSELNKLIVSMGGMRATSQLLGINYYTLNSWKVRGRVSASEAKNICENPLVAKKGFTKEKLRPDVRYWGEQS